MIQIFHCIHFFKAFYPKSDTNLIDRKRKEINSYHRFLFMLKAASHHLCNSHHPLIKLYFVCVESTDSTRLTTQHTRNYTGYYLQMNSSTSFSNSQKEVKEENIICNIIVQRQNNFLNSIYINKGFLDNKAQLQTFLRMCFHFKCSKHINLQINQTQKFMYVSLAERISNIAFGPSEELAAIYP